MDADAQITNEADEAKKKKFTQILAGHIKTIRKEKKVSQEELAFRAGLNPAYVSHLERGIYSASFYIVWKIAKALNMTLQEFLENFPRLQD